LEPWPEHECREADVKRFALAGAVILVIAAAGVVTANGNSDRKSFKAQLSGYQEVPAISTTGTGELKLTVNANNTQIAYTLRYAALQGGAAMAAHIHLGQSGVSGAVAAFLCGGGTKPVCPAAGGTVSGTIVAADVLAIPTQGLAAGDLAALLRAMRAGVTYANVHSVTFAGGEIRGQIGGRGNGGQGNDD
jgi:CHRD domain-containing protein